MPTESAFFFAGLLFTAAALGYVFARLGQIDEDERNPPGLDYLRGFKYLLKEQPDRALEALTGSAEIDEDTLETHFSLGQLFRRRGEVERAIRVHRDLIERPNLKREYREQAQFELAQDYLSAGLFDRAEALLAELRSSDRYGRQALGKLLRLSELTREWERAIDLHRELEREDRAAARSGRVAHYVCELAEQARLSGDMDRAAGFLDRVDQGRVETVRTMLCRSALAADLGHHAEARDWLQRVAGREPSLLVDVLPRLYAESHAAGDAAGFSAFLSGQLRQNPAAKRAVALATMLDPAMSDPIALQCLGDFVTADPTLAALIGAPGQGGSGLSAVALPRIRGALQAMAARGRVYRCLECGYQSIAMQWQCPGCGAWDTVRPQVRLAFETTER